MLQSPTAPHTLLKNNGLLLGFVIILFFLNSYNKTLFFRPISIHQWRQTDCLSITKNYYEGGMHFFRPQINWQGVKNGQTVSECPLLNYTTACLWKVFGEHEFIYRLLEYLIFLGAIFVLFNTILRFYRSSILAFFTVSIFLTSPLLTYYSFNFIADVPALSLGIMSFCFFFWFYHTRKLRQFYLSLLFGTLAVLIKASALTGLGILIFFSLVDLLNLNAIFKIEKLFIRKIIPLLAVFISVATIVGWYRYALYYNSFLNNNVFLLTILPIWNLDKYELHRTAKLLFNTLFPLFLNKAMFFLFFSFVLYVAANFKKLSIFLKYSFVFSALFFITYLLFFFEVFTVHDYYLNNLMIFPVITLLCFVHIVSSTTFLETNKVFIRSFVGLLIIFNGTYSAATYRLRMIEKDNLPEWFPFISKEEIDLADYFFWEYNKGWKTLETITPDLRRAGIQRDDFVLSVPDASFDISLYLMDQKGFTISRDDFSADSNIVHRMYSRKNIKYLVVNDTLIERDRAFKKIIPELQLVFSKSHVQVYKFKTSL